MIALVYTQCVTLCARLGRPNSICEAWDEWCGSVVGSNDQTLRQSTLHDAVLSALSTDKSALPMALKLLEEALSGKCESNEDSERLGVALKCAGNASDAGLVDHV